VSKTVADAADRLEKRSRVHQVPERRSRSRRTPALDQALRVASTKLAEFARLHGAAPAEVAVVSASSMRRKRADLVYIAMFLIFFLTLVILSGCSHPRQARVNVPPPPPPAETGELPPKSAPASVPNHRTGDTKLPTESENGSDADLAEPTLPAGATPLTSETGLASWYGPPYHNRRGSNGEFYNMHAMTAAHRTLPLGSIVRVTNLKTGSSALVRITDRGPFIPDASSISPSRPRARSMSTSPALPR